MPAPQPPQAPGQRPTCPGDEAPPGTPATGEDFCRACRGTGRIEGRVCGECGGTGIVVEGIGGG